jgi:hypothetical protein
MTPIRIFNEDIEFLAEIDNYETLRFERKMYSAGAFSLRLNANIKYANELKKNRIITIGNSQTKAGIIKTIQYVQGETEILTVSGFELKGIFRQRITIPPAGFSHQRFNNKEVETIMKDIVKLNCIDTAGFEFENFEVATDLQRGDKRYTATRYKNLEEEIFRIGKSSEMGSYIYLDFTNKKMMFDVMPVTDKTSGSANPVIFSTKYNNILKQDYYDSDTNNFNYALVGGQGVGDARTITHVGTPFTNFELSVTFVDARDIDDIDELTTRGEEKLSQTQSEISFDCLVSQNKPFQYETDYDLGTKVTIENERLNISFDKTIEAITEYYTETGFDVEMTFGTTRKSVKTYIDINTDYGID